MTDIDALAEFLLARYDEDEAWADHLWFEGDRDRWLADIKAKRRVVEECRALDSETCDCCAFGRADDMLRALASPYADHHDYRQEWTP
jgi:hypothetical protein